MVRKAFLAALLTFVVFWIAGCQTVQGLGGDITWTGKAGAEALEGAFDPYSSP